MIDLLIVGAGITGLTAAYDVTRCGLRAVVIEAGPRAGGLILTEHTGGFTIDGGADSVLAQKPAGLQLCEELGLTDRLIDTAPPRRAFVLRGMRLHSLPTGSVLGIPLTWRGLASYDLLPWRARVRLAAERAIPPRRDGGDESVASFFRRRFGAAAVDLIASPLLGGIHAGEIEQLSVHSLFPRLVEAERQYGSVTRGLIAGRDVSTKDARFPGAASSFRSLRGGMGELVGAVESRLPKGTIRYDTPAERLERAGIGWRITAGGDALEARAVLVAAPAYVAAGLLASIDPEAARLCGEVPYVSTASVALAWPRTAVQHPLAGSGFVVARRSNDVRITACTWVSSKWPDRAPAGFVLLRAFLGGSHDASAVDLPDEDLTGVARRDLSRILGITAAPVLSRIYRWRRAGAQHHVGQLARMFALDQRLASHLGLFVAGSGFRATGVADCVADARRAAADVTQFLTATDKHE